MSEMKRDKWFAETKADELEFKRLFALQFLASLEAVNYERNCSLGRWPPPAVEDAAFLAEKAWEQWKKVIGVR